MRPASILVRFQFNGKYSHQPGTSHLGANLHSRTGNLLCSFRAFCGEPRLYHIAYRRAGKTSSVQVLAILGGPGENKDEDADSDSSTSNDSNLGDVSSTFIPRELGVSKCSGALYASATFQGAQTRDS